jgi:hypothetical protein
MRTVFEKLWAVLKAYIVPLLTVASSVGGSAGVAYYLLRDPAPTPQLVDLPESIELTADDLGEIQVLEAKSQYKVAWQTFNLPKGVKAFPVGNSLFFSSKVPTDFVIGAVVAPEKDQVSRTFTTRVKAGKAPIPPPTPPVPPTPPNPVPVPPTPPTPPNPPQPVVLGEFGKLVLLVSMKIAKPDDARALAENFSSVTSAIRAGGIQTREVAVQTLAAANKRALQGKEQPWLGFFNWLDNEMTLREQSGKISTMEHRAEHFEQVAAALREGAK